MLDPVIGTLHKLSLILIRPFEKDNLSLLQMRKETLTEVK